MPSVHVLRRRSLADAVTVDQSGNVVMVDDASAGRVAAATTAGAASALRNLFPADDPNAVIQTRTIINGALAGVTGWALIKIISSLTGTKR